MCGVVTAYKRVGRLTSSSINVSMFSLCYCLSLLSDVVAAVTVNREKQRNGLYYAVGAIMSFALLLGCLYCCKQICPSGVNFTSLELDEIRLERLDDIEQNLEENIKNMKDKLAYHRKKKTGVQIDRDVRLLVGARASSFNEKGRETYGEDWDKGNVPVKDIVKLTNKEAKEIKKEADRIAIEHKEEEKKDLWAMWNDVRKDNKKGGVVTAGGIGTGNDDNFTDLSNFKNRFDDLNSKPNMSMAIGNSNRYNSSSKTTSQAERYKASQSKPSSSSSSSVAAVAAQSTASSSRTTNSSSANKPMNRSAVNQMLNPGATTSSSSSSSLAVPASELSPVSRHNVGVQIEKNRVVPRGPHDNRYAGSGAGAGSTGAEGYNINVATPAPKITIGSLPNPYANSPNVIASNKKPPISSYMETSGSDSARNPLVEKFVRPSTAIDASTKMAIIAQKEKNTAAAAAESAVPRQLLERPPSSFNAAYSTTTTTTTSASSRPGGRPPPPRGPPPSLGSAAASAVVASNSNTKKMNSNPAMQKGGLGYNSSTSSAYSPGAGAGAGTGTGPVSGVVASPNRSRIISAASSSLSSSGYNNSGGGTSGTSGSGSFNTSSGGATAAGGGAYKRPNPPKGAPPASKY